MASKTKVSVGILILVLLASGIVYVEWSNNARIRVDFDKSTFYVPNEDRPWIWSVSGREYNKLYDGTKLMYRDRKGITVETTYDDTKVIVKRTTPYIRGPTIIDTYLFDGNTDNIELFPISHTVEVLNAKGKYYRYEVRDLQYDGETFKLSGQTSMGFGRNMKVTWWDDYRLGWVYKSGSMYVKSQKLESDYEVFNVRLFDPVQYGYTLTLYLDEVNNTRKYEYFTVANITANVSVCEEAQCDLCVDIGDSINNVSLGFGNKNYSCGNGSVSFLYNITKLRVNQFNDSNLSLNVTNNSRVYLSLDNRTEIESFTFNVTGYNSTAVTIDDTEDNWSSEGTISNPELAVDEDFNTAAEGGASEGIIFENYTIVSTIANLTWKYIINSGIDHATTQNATVDCWNGTVWLGVDNAYVNGTTVTNTSTVTIPSNCLEGSVLRLKTYNLTGVIGMGGTSRSFDYYEGRVEWIEDDFPQNVSVDADQDDISDILLLGRLIGTKLYTDSFISDDTKYGFTNLTRSSAGTKTLYVNLTTSGFNQDTPVLNFSIQIDGFNVDDGNDLNYTEYFDNSGINATFDTNISNFSNVEDFYNNDSSDWTVDLGVDGDMYITDPFTDSAYLYMRLSVPDQDNPNDQITQFSENIAPFDVREAYQFKTNLTSGYSFTNFPNAFISFSRFAYLSDGTTDINLWSHSASGSESSSSSSSDTLDLHGIRTSDTDWNIYKEGVLSKSISTSSLDPDIKPYLKFRLEYDNTGGTGRRSFASSFSLYNLSVAGVSLAMNASNYSAWLEEGQQTNYTSGSLNITENNLMRATLNATVYEPANTDVAYYMSNDGATTWESVTNGLTHAFSSTGDNISVRFELNTSNGSVSPLIYRYNVDITPTPVEDVFVDVGADGDDDWNYTGVINETNGSVIFRYNGSETYDYVSSNCIGNISCYMPITITFGTAGTLQFSNFNLTLNPNPINITPSLVEPFNPIDLLITMVDGFLGIANIELDFLGSKNITFFTHWYNNTSFNDSFVMQVKYSNFNVSLPENVSYWEVFPSTKDSQNVTPFGQNNETPSWNVTSLAYDDPFDFYIKTNESLNACYNISFSNDSLKQGSHKLNTTSEDLCLGVDTLDNEGSCGVWNWVDLTNCTNRFELPWFFWSAKCANCVNTTGFDDTNLIT